MYNCDDCSSLYREVTKFLKSDFLTVIHPYNFQVLCNTELDLKQYITVHYQIYQKQIKMGNINWSWY